jgi:hypothetical protein
MNTNDQALAIIRRITEMANAGEPVSFETDWGGNTLTVFVGNAHTHVGTPDGTEDQLVDQLYELLINGRGLSWHEQTTQGFTEHKYEQPPDNTTPP